MAAIKTGSHVKMNERDVGLEMLATTASGLGLTADERLESGLEGAGLGGVKSELM
jgi:hypothetical protein